TLYTTANQTISTTAGTTVTSLQTTVAATTYRVHAVISWAQGSAAAQQNFWFNGPTASAINVPYYFALSSSGVSNGVGVATKIGSGGGASMPSPAFAASSSIRLYFDGLVTFSAAGTFGVTTGNNTSGDTCTIQALSFMDIMPVV
ncbi:MAG TPA: hypothetical protein VGF75_00490, partial [Candidatus Saccharimonadales bacterium]